MIAPVFGVVQGGKVIPQSPLPEGAVVRITLASPAALPPDLQDEFDQWSQGSAEALAAVEDLAEAGRDQG